MPDIDDLKLEKTPAPPPPPQPPWLLILVAVVLLLALAAIWYYMRQTPGPDANAGARNPAPAAARPIEEPSAATELPPLAQTDALVRELVRALSQHPIVAALLTTDQLIRTFAVSVMNIADGDTPSRHLFTIKPQDTFQVQQRSGAMVIDARSYARFDPHAAAVDGLDAGGAARIYETLKPRIQEAYRELAGENADFDRTLARAIIHLLETPVVEGDIAVERAIVGYTYADPRLESLSRAQQQLLRMGPDNVRRVQNKLRAIAGYLGIGQSSLPRERVVPASR
jgi:hypothetical protein